jgi:hypothetical protein
MYNMFIGDLKRKDFTHKWFNEEKYNQLLNFWLDKSEAIRKPVSSTSKVNRLRPVIKNRTPDKE